MDLYLAGGTNRKFKIIAAQEGLMDIYLAGNMMGNKGRFISENTDSLYCCDEKKVNIAILESFYYADRWCELLIPKLSKFLLDSGAFTFFSSGKHVNWDDYLRRYADFINRNNVKRFFELDIDVLVGYERVKEFRRKLEAMTGKKCIPVWHKSRGWDEFLRMCDDYDYVSIGGIVSKEITSREYKYFPKFIREAHQRGCKIHGLGFTSLEGIRKYHFDSVDSTSWTIGNRFGAIYTFDGRTMVKTDAPAGKGLKDHRTAAIRNFNEWVKFQKYAERNL